MVGREVVEEEGGRHAVGEWIMGFGEGWRWTGGLLGLCMAWHRVAWVGILWIDILSSFHA